MKKKPFLLYIALCLLPALSMAAETPPSKKPAAATQPELPITPRDLVTIAGGVAMLGALAADVTVGEAFVRAYPSKVLAAEGWGDLESSIKLSCDTYRNISGNRMIAAATACNVGFELVAKSPGYTLSGPFREVEHFEGRSCEAARQACEAYRVTVTRKGKTVELREKNKLLGTVNFSGLTPQYNLAK